MIFIPSSLEKQGCAVNIANVSKNRICIELYGRALTTLICISSRERQELISNRGQCIMEMPLRNITGERCAHSK